MDRMLFAVGQASHSRAIEIVVLSALGAVCALVYAHNGVVLLSRPQFDPCFGYELDVCDSRQQSVDLNAQGLPVTWFLLLLAVSRALLCMLAQVHLFVSFRWYSQLGHGVALGGSLLYCLLLSVVFSLIIFVPSSLYGIELAVYLAVRRATKWCNILLRGATKSMLSTGSFKVLLPSVMSSTGRSFILSTLRTCMIIGLGVYTVEPFSSLCLLACISALVVLAVFFIVFPACFSLASQMSVPRRVSSLPRPPSSLPANQAEDGVSQIQTVMMLGLVFVHIRSFLGTFGAGKTYAAVHGDQSPDVSSQDYLMLVLLRQNYWWNYLCYFLQWCGTVVILCMFRDPAVSDVASRYFGMANANEKQVSFRENVSAKHAGSSDVAWLTADGSGVTCADSSYNVQQDLDILKSTSTPAESQELCVKASSDRTADRVGEVGSVASGCFMGTGSSEVGALSGSDVALVCSDEAAASPGVVFTIGGDSDRSNSGSPVNYECRSMEDCVVVMETDGLASLTSDEVMLLVHHGKVKERQLELLLSSDMERAVKLRRMALSGRLGDSTDGGALVDLPCKSYNYSQVYGVCCENVIGYVPVPVGVAGPLLLDGREYHVPMATTEGCLVASTNRGCSALQKSGGVVSCLVSDGMTRAPVLKFPSIVDACAVKQWCQAEQTFTHMKSEFDSTSNFARLQSVHCSLAGTCLHLRFCATTGDAMGMNMISKGVDKALRYLLTEFPTASLVSLSGNYCTDKKPSAVNWVMGRGKSVVCEATLPSDVVKKVLKTSAHRLADLNRDKNLVGSAMAGSIGGFNAHAANIVVAVFIATGQDVAQSGTSSACLTQMEAIPCCSSSSSSSSSDSDEECDLHITCTMPCLETGTVGGGTNLAPQQACLKMLGINGPNRDTPGQNSARLASIICATVMAGELSLMAALTTGDLVKSHLRHNRSSSSLPSLSSSPFADAAS